MMRAVAVVLVFLTIAARGEDWQSKLTPWSFACPGPVVGRARPD